MCRKKLQIRRENRCIDVQSVSPCVRCRASSATQTRSVHSIYSDDSHDLVTYLMVFMNYNTAKDNDSHIETGYFRNVVAEVPPETHLCPDTLERDVLVFFKTWNSYMLHSTLICLGYTE